MIKIVPTSPLCLFLRELYGSVVIISFYRILILFEVVIDYVFLELLFYVHISVK
jgi:hypothetical protein